MSYGANYAGHIGGTSANLPLGKMRVVGSQSGWLRPERYRGNAHNDAGSVERSGQEKRLHMIDSGGEVTTLSGCIKPFGKAMLGRQPAP